MAWAARPDGHIFWYNKRWYEYTGMTQEQTEGWGWQPVCGPEELPKVLERWQESIDTGKSFEMVFPLRAANGEYGSFLTRVLPFRGSDGQIVQWFGTNTDITERVRMEDALRQAREELEDRVQKRTIELFQKTEDYRRNELRYRSLVEATAAVVWNTPASGEFESAQPGWSKLTGQSFEQLRGWGWLNAIHPDDQQYTAQIWSAATAGRERLRGRASATTGRWRLPEHAGQGGPHFERGRRNC